MKKKTFFLLALFGITVALSSCKDVLEGEIGPIEEKAIANVETKAAGNDSLNVESILPLEETKELKALKEKLIVILITRYYMHCLLLLVL